MENQKLPNVTLSLILGIVSFIACCCTNGLGGLILSGIALYLAKKDETTYQENPEIYDNYSQLKTAKTVAIVGLVLAGIVVLSGIIALIMFGGLAGYQEWIQQMQEQYGA